MRHAAAARPCGRSPAPSSALPDSAPRSRPRSCAASLVAKSRALRSVSTTSQRSRTSRSLRPSTGARTLSSATTHSLAPRRTSAASRLVSWSESRNSDIPSTLSVLSQYASPTRHPAAASSASCTATAVGVSCASSPISKTTSSKLSRFPGDPCRTMLHPFPAPLVSLHTCTQCICVSPRAREGRSCRAAEAHGDADLDAVLLLGEQLRRKRVEVGGGHGHASKVVFLAHVLDHRQRVIALLRHATPHVSWASGSCGASLEADWACSRSAPALGLREGRRVWTWAMKRASAPWHE
jgi:hypothetical protein